MKLIRDLTEWHTSSALAVGVSLIVVIGALDFVTGYELSLSFFYLIPVSLISWTSGKWWGMAAALLSAVVWTTADRLAGQTYSTLFYIFWHAAARAAVLCSIALLFAALRRSVDHEKSLARIDHLTGAANVRSFLETLRSEIERSRRYKRPFTLAYVDLDNFKVVNDSFGHAAGDLLLQTVVSVIRSQVRSTDVVARLGGDEFGLLLPEADQQAAVTVITKMRESLLLEMGRRGWPVTVSIGALTSLDTGLGVDELLKEVDDLMYASKVKGKNAITFA
ncbi:MAG TPA: GGDEF domain-containing protein [Spirochaetia bacterium]|nr:GGDEF domain-containing protein [Spirochaetia bacterium]